MTQKLTAEEIVKRDMDTLYIGNLNTVEFDLRLPEKGPYGSSITWQSGHERYLGHDGRVSRPAYGMGNRTISLTARFRYGDVTGEKVYPVRILEEENRLQARKVYDVAVCAEPGGRVDFPGAAIVETMDGDIISHPVTWKEDSGVFETCGSFRREGVLTGTEIPVGLKITVRDAKKKERKIPKPAVEDVSEERFYLQPGSEFYRAQERMRAFLHAVDADQMLYNFRQAAGLSTKGAPCMEGWDAPDSQLRGHTTGHYLSALALCYHSCQDEKIREKALYMVQALRECQEAFSRQDGTAEGFLSGYPEDQFDLLEQFTPYPEIWAPYYTLHKLFAGLLDCWQYLKDETALNIVKDLGMWVYRRLSRLDRRTRSRMWGMYIAGEFGGMNEVLARLYRITGTEEYLAAAKMFDNDRLFYPLEAGTDALSTMHANQHIPQILGALEIYRATGEERYLHIAERFWEFVTADHAYAPGGTGEGEMFHRKGQIGSLLTKNTMETCASYNMLKLTKALYELNPSARYVEYYERTLLNHILATPDKSVTGESLYFFPLAPGSRREFEPENSCCHGTGMENQFRYTDAVYFRDKDTLYLNLFLPSVLELDGGKVKISQYQDENHPEYIKIEVQGGLSRLAVRKPEWAADNCRILVNGELVPAETDDRGYFCFTPGTTEAFVLEMVLPYSIQLRRTPDRPEIAAVQAGPYILAALSDEKEFLHIPLEEGKPGECLKREGDSAEYSFGDIRLVPLWKTDREIYHVYVDTE